MSTDLPLIFRSIAYRPRGSVIPSHYFRVGGTEHEWESFVNFAHTYRMRGEYLVLISGEWEPVLTATTPTNKGG